MPAPKTHRAKVTGFIATALQQRQDLVQHLRQTARIIEKVCNRAEEIAEQVAGARLGGDVEDDAAQVDLQAENVQRDRPDVEMQN